MSISEALYLAGVVHARFPFLWTLSQSKVYVAIILPESFGAGVLRHWRWQGTELLASPPCPAPKAATHPPTPVQTQSCAAPEAQGGGEANLTLVAVTTDALITHADGSPLFNNILNH